MPNVFPVSPLNGWSVKKTPSWRTLIQTVASGREARVQLQNRPKWRWELTYEIIRDKWDTRGAGLGVGYDELRTLMGFYLLQNGPFIPFLFTDPSDSSLTNNLLAVGNGSTTAFQLTRTMNGYTEIITTPNLSAAFNIRLNNVPLAPSGYSVNATTGIVTFVAAPGNGVVIAVDFSYYWQVRFEQDSEDFENFMLQLWRKQSLKLIQVF